MLEKGLLQLGFSKNETSVYLALFSFGKVRAGIIIDETKLHRNIVYTALESLVARELVTKTMVSGVAEYAANDPSALVEEVERKKQQAQMVSEQLHNKQVHHAREVKILEGLDGIKRVNDRSLRLPSGETAYVFGSPTFGVNDALNTHWKSYHKKRIEKNIAFRILYDRSVEPSVLDYRNSLDITEARYMPSGFDMPMWMYMSGDEFSIVTAEENPLVVNIKSKEITDAFVQYFEFLWNQEIVVETGLDALERSIYEILNALAPGEEYFVLGASVGLTGDPGQQLYDKFHIERVKKGVVVNMLAYEESYDLIKKRFAYSGDPESKISHLKKTIAATPIPMQINMCKGKTRLFLYGEEPVVIHLDRPEIHDGFKSYFDALWNQKTKTFQGEGAKEKAFQDILDTLEPGEEVLVMGMFDFDDDFADFVVDFHTRRAKEGKYGRVLINADAKALAQRFKKVDKTEIFSMPQGIVTPGVFLVYGNKSLITLPNQRTFIQIENQEAADAFRVYFEQQWKQDTRVVQGAQAVKQIWLESLETGQLDFIGARGYFVDLHPDMFREISDKAKKVKDLKWRNVVDGSAKDHALNKLPWMEARYTIKGSKTPSVIWLWGQKVAIANWTEDEPVLFISENKHLVQSYRDYFDELWGEK